MYTIKIRQESRIKRWNEGGFLPFPKKGNLALKKNYRCITLTSIASKIYNLMLLNRIRPKIEDILRKNQNGFRTNRSTTGQILTIRRLIEGVKSKNVPALLLFIDFSKAFDSIDRLKLKYILSAYGIPKETINAIMILYTNTRAMVRSPDGYTPFFDITTGVLHGDTLAPYLFIICLDYIMRTSIDNNSQYGLTLTERKSSRYPAFTITDVDYADDIAITTNNVKEANILLNSLEKTAKEIGLHINVAKTEYMAYNQNSTDMIKTQNEENIKKTQDFKYLGSFIASTEHDINVRIGKACAALNQMNNIWNSKLSKNLKRNFFRATVESVFVYGAITWTLKTKLENKIDGAYTRMLRAALNVSWKEHLTNKELYGKTPKVTSSIREQRLRFTGHCWRSKKELICDVLIWLPKNGKRSRGRPAKTFVDQLVDDTECNVDELMNEMNDRDEWKLRDNECRASSTW